MENKEQTDCIKPRRWFIVKVINQLWERKMAIQYHNPANRLSAANAPHDQLSIPAAQHGSVYHRPWCTMATSAYEQRIGVLIAMILRSCL